MNWNYLNMKLKSNHFNRNFTLTEVRTLAIVRIFLFLKAPQLQAPEIVVVASWPV